MAVVSVTHKKVVSIPDDPNYPVGSDEWNDNHAVSGLENVDNTSDVNKPVSTAQAAAIAAGVASVTKASLGLGNVDNTSDANKPVSTAQAAAIAARLPLTGGTLTGDLTISNPDPLLVLNKANGNAAAIFGQQGGLNRWSVQPGSSISEAGGNVGSDFLIGRHDDAGTFIDIPFSINRGTGSATFLKPATFDAPVSIRPATGTFDRGIDIFQASPSGGSFAGSIYSNLIQGSINCTLTGPGGPGSVNGPNWSLLQVSASTGANYNGIESYGLSVGNVVSAANTTTSDLVGLSCGVATGFAYGGNIYGGTSAATVTSSGSVRALIGHEIGVEVDTATGVPFRYGLNVDNYGSHTATGVDTAISIQGGAAGGSWKAGITFTNPGGALAPSIATTGNMIASEAALTVANVLDLHNVTVTNDIIVAPSAVLTGQGILALGDDTTNSGGFGLHGPAGANLASAWSYGGSATWTMGATSSIFYLSAVGAGSNAMQVPHSTNRPEFPNGLAVTQNPANAPAIDGSGISTGSVANGSNTQIGGSGTLFVLVKDPSQTGDVAMYLLNTTASALVTQIGGGSWVASTTTPAAGKQSIAWDGSGHFRIYNNAGGAVNYNVTTIKVN